MHDQKLVSQSFRDWGRDCWCPSLSTTPAQAFRLEAGWTARKGTITAIATSLISNLLILRRQSVGCSFLAEFVEARRIGKSCVGLSIARTCSVHWLGCRSWFQLGDTGCRSECSWFGSRRLCKCTIQPNELARNLDVSIVVTNAVRGNLLRHCTIVSR